MLYLKENAINTTSEKLYLHPLVWSYALFFIILIIILVYIIIVSRKKHRYKQVKKYSTAYQNLCEINQKYRFSYLIESVHLISETYPSKQKWDRVDINKRSMELLYNDNYLNLIREKITENREKYKEYTKEVNTILKTPKECITMSNVPLKQFIRIENTLWDETMLKPPQDIEISITFRYVSPQGRKHYENTATYYFDDYLFACVAIPLEQQRVADSKTQQQFERAKMSNSLRYDIMKRDGFRCVLCGAKAFDSITLHVDHIIPIAKGGKTEWDNLRTLCDRCNSGKRDKYDYNGLN